MNAFIREKYEAHVLTNETIEVHLTYLRSGLDAVQAALPVLRDKIDLLSMTVDSKIEKTNTRIEAFNTSLGEKIEAFNTSLGDRIDAFNTSLSQKIENATEQLAASDAALSGRIENLTEKVSNISNVLAGLQGQMKALLWLLSMAGIVASVVSIARTLAWI